MLRNYLITIFRIITRNKLFTVIHISGLALGLACAVLILLMVGFERSFDRFHEKISDLYLLRVTIFMEPSDYTSDRSGAAFGPMIARTFPEVEAYCRYRSTSEVLINATDGDGEKQSFIENSLFAVDSTFLSMFLFPLIAGDPSTALDDDYSIVITEKMAMKLFSSTDIIGKSIRVNDKYNFIVTAVAKDPPQNTFFQFDYLVPFDFLCELGISTDSYGGTMTSVFFHLREGATLDNINEQLPELSDQWHEADIEYRQFLVPLYDAHMTGETQNGKAMFIFLLVAFLILIIACINYTNITTARFTARAREVGIRKALGADKQMLFFQFLGEAILKSFIALDVALLILEIILPIMNDYFEITLLVPYTDPGMILILAGLVLFTGILAGTYPAMILASFNPVKVLKNPWLHGHKGKFIRKALVTIQFSIAVAFILVSIFLVMQHDHIKTGDERIRKENVIFFETKGDLWQKYDEFRAEVSNIPGIEYISTGSKVPFNIDIGEFEYGLVDENQTSLAMICWADYDYAKLFHLDMVEGEFFREGVQTNDRRVVINKKMQDFLDIENPVGETFYVYHDRYVISGVVEDFDFFPLSLTDQMLIMPFSDISAYIFISMDEHAGEKTMLALEEKYHDFNPAFPFEYKSVTDHELPMDQAFENAKPMLWFFTVMGIFISLLGLFGLASFTAAQKVTEIGIRKTFGANTGQIVRLLSFQFLRPVLLAIIIGFGLAYLVLNYLLGFFNSPVALHWWIFVLTAVGMVLISQLTVIGQALRAARRHPVDCLRYE